MANKKVTHASGTVEEMSFKATKMNLLKFVSKDFKRHEMKNLRKMIARELTKAA